MNPTEIAEFAALARRPRPTGRYMVKCKCGTFATDIGSDLFRFTAYTGDFGACWTCHRMWKVTPVKGTVNPDHKCNGVCTSAKGGSCDCACGGKNHGVSRL